LRQRDGDQATRDDDNARDDFDAAMNGETPTLVSLERSIRFAKSGGASTPPIQ
jgi:hypothetical protein